MASADKIYSAEQITVPQELPQILKAFAKEVIRYNPSDIPQFGVELSIIIYYDICRIKQYISNKTFILQIFYCNERK